MTRHFARLLAITSLGHMTRAIRLLLLTLLVLGVASCAAGNSNFSAAPTSAPAAPAAPRAALGGPVQAPAGKASAAVAGQAASPPVANSTSGSSQPATSAAIAAAPFDRLAIRNAKLTLQVTDVEAALVKVRAIADADGGYVTASHTYFVKDGDKDEMVADITIAVRSDSYDQAVQALRETASKVENEDGTSQDVTDQYVDLDARLRNLQASEDSLLKLETNAGTLDDVLTLERELANVRGQIEQIQGQMRLIQNETSMSTISISMHLPPAPPPPPIVPVWNPLATFARGWNASLIALQSIADVLISIVSFFWWLTPFFVGGYLIFRRSRRVAPVVSP